MEPIAWLKTLKTKKTLIFVVWASASILAGGALMSAHQPFLTSEVKLLPLIPGAPTGTWRAVHLLAADCGCSQKVLRHLMSRASFQTAYEEVVLLGDAPSLPDIDELRKHGFHVQRITGTAVEIEDFRRKFGLTGVPLLAFVSPLNKTAYIGGYGVGEFRDESIWSQLKAGSSPPSLPVLGCAVGNRLKQRIIPLSGRLASLFDSPN